MNAHSDHEAPTRRDMTAADADLFAHDARKPRHDPFACTVARCWVCRLHWGHERLADESRAEREYDAREAS